MKRLSISFLLFNFLYAVFTLCVFNFYPLTQIWNSVSLFVFVPVFFVLLMILMAIQGLIFWPKTVKILSVLLMLGNALASYFVLNFHLPINKMVLSNVLESNMIEATEWMGISFWVYLLLTFVLPTFVLLKVRIEWPNLKKRLLHFGSLLLGIVLLALPFSFYKTEVAIYLKENFNLRYQLCPSGYLSSAVSLAKFKMKKVDSIDSLKGLQHTKYWRSDKKNLVVFVVGESMRDASFSLSGYERDTAEPLKPYVKDMTVFSKTESCAVLTRVSLPCMMTAYNRDNYDERGISYTANVLDILQTAGMNLLWLENEMGCNKMCRNIPTEFVCNSRNCVDMTLNERLKAKIDGFDDDTLVVLHQRGSHGPRYDLRAPEEYHQWKPVCQDANHQNCSYQELKNAYDNSVYYTLFVIADLMKMLSDKNVTDKFNPVVVFVSDHGQSLGEEGVYGHGGEFKDAPVYQREVPFFVWMPQSTREALKMDKQCLDRKTQVRRSHDEIFHSLLGINGVRTDVYDKNLDIFDGCHP